MACNVKEMVVEKVDESYSDELIVELANVQMFSIEKVLKIADKYGVDRDELMARYLETLLKSATDIRDMIGGDYKNYKLEDWDGIL